MKPGTKIHVIVDEGPDKGAKVVFEVIDWDGELLAEIIETEARLGKLCKKGQAARDAVAAALEKIRREQAEQGVKRAE